MIYQEHFVERQYLQHGVQLMEGDTVIDVGGHCGLFACYAAQAVGSSGRVVALEPAPATFECCKANAESLARWSEQQQGAPSASVEVVNAACGDGSADRMMLTVYDRATLMNTLVPTKRQEEMLAAYIKQQLVVGKPTGNFLERLLIRGGHLALKLKRVAPLLERGILNHVRYHILKKQSQVPCRVLTVSSVMEDHGLSTVGLLKVDAECADLMVLMGVRAEDWPRIRQVAMEVHEEGLKDPVIRLLRDVGGFTNVVCHPGDSSLGEGVYNVWATRGGP